MVKEWWDGKRRGSEEGWDGKGRRGVGEGWDSEGMGVMVKEGVWERVEW